MGRHSLLYMIWLPMGSLGIAATLYNHERSKPEDRDPRKE
jgi:hypothetical protein